MKKLELGGDFHGELAIQACLKILGEGRKGQSAKSVGQALLACRMRQVTCPAFFPLITLSRFRE